MAELKRRVQASSVSTQARRASLARDCHPLAARPQAPDEVDVETDGDRPLAPRRAVLARPSDEGIVDLGNLHVFPSGDLVGVDLREVTA